LFAERVESPANRTSATARSARQTNKYQKILVVDDHPFLREGIVGAINSQSDMVLIGEASNGKKVIEQFRLHRSDVTLNPKSSRKDFYNPNIVVEFDRHYTLKK
jgi:PleD family two-component response regulator